MQRFQIHRRAGVPVGAILLAALAVAMFAAGPRAWADVLHVPGDFPTIQAAIDAATDGDEVLVARGTYMEAIDFLGKAITVRSADGPEATTIDASEVPGGASVVRAASGEGADTILDGFTITGGAGAPFGASQLTFGGGMFNLESSPTIKSCRFVDNSVTGSGGGMYNNKAHPEIIDCTFEGNSANYAGGMANINSSPSISGTTFRNNSAAQLAGGMSIGASSEAKLTNCRFIGNTAFSGAGIYNVDGATPTIFNTKFLGNVAEQWGGGAVDHNLTAVTYINCIFVGNKASYGGGIAVIHDDAPTIIHCTFYGNEATQTGGGLWSFAGIGFWKPAITGSIFWENSPNQLHENQSVASEVSFSNVQGGWPGPNNFSADPLFVDPAGPDGILGTDDDNVRLLPGSPAIDAGNNAAVPPEITVDLDGNPRIVDGNGDGVEVVDLGAYEFQPETTTLGDLTGNGQVGVADLLILLGMWGACADCNDCIADLTGNCSVGVADLLILLANWG